MHAAVLTLISLSLKFLEHRAACLHVATVVVAACMLTEFLASAQHIRETDLMSVCVCFSLCQVLTWSTGFTPE